jgi:two-component system, response regulator RegA
MVLLVDDDESILITLSALLEDEGLTVVTANSLTQARDRLASTDQFTVVLLDRKLGDENGLSLVEEIRARQPQARLIVLTGAKEKVSPEGLDGVVGKDEGVEVLLQAIRGSRAPRNQAQPA